MCSCCFSCFSLGACTKMAGSYSSKTNGTKASWALWLEWRWGPDSMAERRSRYRMGTLLGILLLSFNWGSKLSNPVTAVSSLSPCSSNGAHVLCCTPLIAEASLQTDKGPKGLVSNAPELGTRMHPSWKHCSYGGKWPKKLTLPFSRRRLLAFEISFSVGRTIRRAVCLRGRERVLSINR